MTNPYNVTDRDVVLGIVENLGACSDFVFMVRVANRGKNQRIADHAQHLEKLLKESRHAAALLLACYK